ncbi:organic cation/carnitine transporter 7-like isoform X1 [Hibiscus syriacus]|uniref:Organic cation/carnitine transporter 7-like isoform X1 n=1 Tax=Hibiscus syriacus TaxID=106335 RepID=A0A6A3D080_HIBSY|nr:organic cation/carnitine transporter 7-like isoform X1 [Hibiscus syriacus]
MPRLGWRWVLAFSSVPSFALLLLFSVAPESPRYLCLKGRTSDALQIMEKVASANQTKLPPGALISGRSGDKDEASAPSPSERDEVGRKQSMAIMFGLAFIFLLPLLAHQPSVLTTFLLFGARMNAMGTFTVASIYSPSYIRLGAYNGGWSCECVGRIVVWYALLLRSDW